MRDWNRRELCIGSLALPLTLLAESHALAEDHGFQIQDTAEQIEIRGQKLQAKIRKKGYVSGVAGGSLVDVKTGSVDLGYGLDVVDWLMENGSDEAYRSELPGDLPYEFNNLVHGKRPKKCIEGPQICTQAKTLKPELVEGPDFVGVRQSFAYTLAAPGKKTGSLWQQTLIFPNNQRYFFAADQVTSKNASDGLFLRTDLPGHVRHNNGDTWSEIYLSYFGRIPAKNFSKDFPPDEKYFYLRDEKKIPKRMIRAYRTRNPKTGVNGPWLAGMTLVPEIVSEAWCHQRGYVCMIQEIGGRAIAANESFGAAYIIGFFDTIAEMESTYDEYSGGHAIELSQASWRLVPSKKE